MIQRIKVLHLIDHLKTGGVQRFISEVFKGMDKKRFELTLAVLHGPGPMEKLIKKTGHSPIYLSGRTLNPLIPFRLRKIIRSGNFDIVHASGVPSCFICEHLRDFLGIQKLVEHVHHISKQQQVNKYQNLAERTIYQKADFLIGCSNAVGNSIKTIIQKQTLYNGVDIEHFKPVKQKKRVQIREKLGFSSKDFIVGITGRITRQKGQHLLCKATAALKDQIPQIKLLIVGSGSEEQSLHKYVNNLGIEENVTFTGEQKNIASLLSVMDVFSMVSSQEGLGMSLLEAMASGLPCVVSDYPASSEIVTDGVDAIRIQCGNLDQLYKAIHQYYQNPQLCEDHGKAARNRIVETFSTSTMVESLSNIYKEICNSLTD